MWEQYDEALRAWRARMKKLQQEGAQAATLPNDLQVEGQEGQGAQGTGQQKQAAPSLSSVSLDAFEQLEAELAAAKDQDSKSS